jgi:hypothetical protein
MSRQPLSLRTPVLPPKSMARRIRSVHADEDSAALRQVQRAREGRAAASPNKQPLPRQSQQERHARPHHHGKSPQGSSPHRASSKPPRKSN